jgi:hypothetical protein
LEPDEALISFLGEDGIPAIVQKAYVLPPQSRMGAITDSERDQSIKSSFLYTKYSRPYDPDSAYEFLQRLGLEEAAAAEQARADALAAKEQAKADAAKAREEAREAQRAEAAKKRAKKTAGSTVAGTVDREAGKGLGDTSGKNHSETSDSNRGAKSRRGFWSTLFKK